MFKNRKEAITYHVVQMAKALDDDKPLSENRRLYLLCLNRAIGRILEHGSEVHHSEIQELAEEIKNHVV